MARYEIDWFLSIGGEIYLHSYTFQFSVKRFITVSPRFVFNFVLVSTKN